MDDDGGGKVVWFDFNERREVEAAPPELVAYVEDQEEELGGPEIRHTPPPEPPWPAQDNPMLAYLTKKAARHAEREGVPAAITWLATHAWFEGHLDGLATLFREMSEGVNSSGEDPSG